MIVQLDIQAAITQRAGVGRYVQALAERLGELRAEDEIRLFYFDFRRRGIPFPTPGASPHACRWLPGRIAQQAWKRLGRPSYDRIAGPADLYHFPNFVRPPLRRGRSVVTIHDVSFLRFPEAAEPRNLAWLQSCMQHTVEQTDAVIVDSEFVAGDVMEYLKAPRGKVFTVPLGIASSLRAPPSSVVRRFRQRAGLERPYLLMVGTLEPRKNIPFLVEVFERMEDYDGDLVLAGMMGWKTGPILERIGRSSRADRIRLLRYVPDGDLPSLYAGADLFMFPSLYEGFGFPPLEAMACGAPVLSSPRGSLAEVLGDAAELLDPVDPAAWAERAMHLLSDGEGRPDRVAAGRRRAASFDWSETARRTWEVYRACR